MQLRDEFAKMREELLVFKATVTAVVARSIDGRQTKHGEEALQEIWEEDHGPDRPIDKIDILTSIAYPFGDKIGYPDGSSYLTPEVPFADPLRGFRPIREADVGKMSLVLIPRWHHRSDPNPLSAEATVSLSQPTYNGNTRIILFIAC
ncbi:MAG: hypothetical protein M1388_04525 [Thaumarchaeota archaeon]|nr:hypothetical protein [Nitrososphaerota archaeon]